MKTRTLLSIFLVLIFLSCSKEVKQEVEVYSNDFESGDLTGITQGNIITYNNNKVLGRYNTSGFDLQLNDLPKHKLVQISFDLYIHDSWDGNKQGEGDVDGPDIWKLIVDGSLYINASFSNVYCDNKGFCPPQSYPLDYPNSTQNPKTGANQRNLPGVCNAAAGTSRYRITRTIEHSKSSLLIQCRDQLTQNNTDDKLCDESWSVDNIQVKVINL